MRLRAKLAVRPPHHFGISPLDTTTSVETTVSTWPSQRGWTTYAIVVVALVLFAAPLFIGLGLWDMRNDESIYSYAVERILETDEWLTPLTIPDDTPFLEKPPLKFWILAGAMRVGLLPNNEAGMRFFDALFGAMTFAYVLAFGWRLAGPVCGFVALLLLFVFDPLLFDHGFRSNNMEGALVLAYAGGMYHFVRWTGEPALGRRRRHALAVAGYFVLGFMTKFVAAVFLPIAAGLALLWRRGALADLQARWREGLLPAALIITACAPWFVYQTIEHGALFWQIILGEHVYRRFTDSLDPAHLAPWYEYFTRLWYEFGYAESFGLVLPGLVLLVIAAIRGRPWLARVLFVWWFAPLVLMSIGTSKLPHYAYPFVPPLAIAGGWFAVLLLQWADEHVVDRLRTRVSGFRAYRWVHDSAARRWAFVALGAGLGALSVWTYWSAEPVTITVGDIRVFRNSSVLRPLVLATPFLALAGFARPTFRAWAVLGVAALLPLRLYGVKYDRLSSVDRPLHAIRECMLTLSAAGTTPLTGVYLSDPELVAHPYYYYFRKTGPWVHGPDGLATEARTRLFEPGAQTPVIMSVSERRRLREAWQEEAGRDSRRPHLDMESIGAVTGSTGVAILLPGPFGVCVDAAERENGRVYLPGRDDPSEFERENSSEPR